MKILLLGYGKESQAAEKYFKETSKNAEIEIWQDFDRQELEQRDYSSYDIIIRSPSVPPLHLPNESSVTQYFFKHCPCPIIGVTATKGKGTTCSFIKSLLSAHQEDVHLVGNIGEPAINSLKNLTEKSIVVYEMSSFQLWDLKTSPHISVIGTIEPDHLNVHKDYEDYLNAKANICRHQSTTDYCIYYKDNPMSLKIANKAPSPQKIPYPFDIPANIKDAIRLPGDHNIRNAIAAIAAVACHKNISPDEYIRDYEETIIQGLSSFTGLPHRLEFIRNLNGIKFYDDNFSTNPSSTRVAVAAFQDHPVIPIIGGRDKTDYADLPEIYEILTTKDIYLPAIVLIGESGHKLYQKYQDDRFILAETLDEAVHKAYEKAKELRQHLAAKKPTFDANTQKLNQITTPSAPDQDIIVLMSPSAASFDMFKNVYDRGEQYQQLVKAL